MKSREFVLQKLKELVRNFPRIKVSYKFDEFTQTHYVKVEPKEIFEKDEEYSDFEVDLILELGRKYPYEGIMFFTEGDSVGIEDFTEELYGSIYSFQNPIPISMSHFLPEDYFTNPEKIFQSVYFNKEIEFGLMDEKPSDAPTDKYYPLAS